MTNPHILHTNKIEAAASISVTSEAAGFEKEKAYDHRTSTFWKASAAGTVYYTVDMGASVAVTSWACYAQDLYSNNYSIKFQYSSDNFSADINDFGLAISPTDNAPIMKTGVLVNARYFRWEITPTSSPIGSAPSIGVLWFGEYLTANTGLAIGSEPLYSAQRFFPVDSTTQDGEFVGRTVKEKPLKSVLRFVSANTEAYSRGDYVTMLREIEKHPFFIITDPTDYPDEVYFCWTDQRITRPQYITNDRLSIDIPIFAKVS